MVIRRYHAARSTSTECLYVSSPKGETSCCRPYHDLTVFLTRGEPRRAASGDGGWREEVRVRFREESASRQTHAHSPACGASAPLRCAAVAAAAARVSALPRLSAEGSTLAPRALMPCNGRRGKGGPYTKHDANSHTG